MPDDLTKRQYTSGRSSFVGTPAPSGRNCASLSSSPASSGANLSSFGWIGTCATGASWFPSGFGSGMRYCWRRIWARCAWRRRHFLRVSLRMRCSTDESQSSCSSGRSRLPLGSYLMAEWDPVYFSMNNPPANSRYSKLSLSQPQSYHVSPDPTIHDRGKWCGFALQATHYGAPRKRPTRWWQSLGRSAGRIDGQDFFAALKKMCTGYGEEGPPQEGRLVKGESEAVRNEWPLLDRITS
jgi:hypothetical protein